MDNFKTDEIIILIGAGASADAGIPVSSDMVERIEYLIKTNADWKNFEDIYYLIKSGVEYSAGLNGNKAIFNVEVLMNDLNELIKKVDHPLYPFIGSWNIRFNEVVKDDFTLLERFRLKIFNELKKWVQPNDLSKAAYLKKIAEFQSELNFPLRIFSLNYDLLLEKTLSTDIERGFNDKKEWDYRRFVGSTDEHSIYLYKLHGSIDWERDEETQIVKSLDSIPEKPDLIFGTQYKLQYVDPYLFFMTQFRSYALEAKIIACFGYSFSDEHINAILSQSFKVHNGKMKKLVVVSKDDNNSLEERIRKNLNLETCENLRIERKPFKQFLEEEKSLKQYCLSLFDYDNGNIIK